MALFSSCALSNKKPNIFNQGMCFKQVEKASIKKLITDDSNYQVVGMTYHGLGVKKLGNLRLHLYTVEIESESDGAVMAAFVEEQTCRIHDVVFGTQALSR